MEYKIGDFIQIKSKKEIDNTEIRIGWTYQMSLFCETIWEIERVDLYDGSSGIYTIYHFKNEPEEMKRWLWTSEMFRPYYDFSEPEEKEVMNLLF